MTGEENKLFTKVDAILRRNSLFYDVTINGNYIIIAVVNGDWKHDHLALRHVMYENGFELLGRHIDDDETSDDSFSATYLYTIK